MTSLRRRGSAGSQTRLGMQYLLAGTAGLTADSFVKRGEVLLRY